MARNNNTLFFFDPSNNRTLDLPCAVYFHYDKLFFFHPPTSPDCTVFAISTPVGIRTVDIHMLKRGEYEWEHFEFTVKHEYLVSHASPVLHRGHIYFLDVKGNVARFNIINQRLVISSKCLTQQRESRVEEEEDLFGVFVFHEEKKVKVFRLSEGPCKNMEVLMPKKIKWELVDDIGDNVLYLNHASSFVCTADTKHTANRIYFPLFHGDNAVFYSLSDGKYHSLNGDYSSNNAYGLKRLDFAAWVTPSLITTTSQPELGWTRSQLDR